MNANSSFKKSIFAILIGLAGLSSLAQNSVTIKHNPEHPLKEKGSNSNSLNFDFIVENISKDTLRLTRLQVSLFDKNNLLVQQKFLDNNGTAPSINTIPNIQWNGVSKKLMFNPFPEINTVTNKLEYTFTFNDTIEVKNTVFPSDYSQIQNFNLPLKSKLLVYDGHDFYSHHRRFNYEFSFIKELGFAGNFMRYAYDFVVLNSEGKQHTNTGENNTDWFGFGSEVLAIGDGEIAALESNQKDDKKFDIPALKTNPLALYGNYLVIKHSEDVYSLYGHLQNKSVGSLKVGDKIKKGQKIGAIGTSGSSFFPHLHLEIRNNLNHESEGLPSYFDNYYLILGATKKNIKTGALNTGDIIQSK